MTNSIFNTPQRIVLGIAYAFLLMLIAVNIANADGGNGPPRGDIDINIDNNVWADASADASASANAGANATADNNITFKAQKQVPGMGAPSVFSSHACAYGRSAVLAVRDFGVGGGGQKIDVDCADREWARMMFAFGMEDAARELACASPSGRKLEACMDDVYSYMFDYGPDRLMADVTQEEYEQQIKLVEHQYIQQQNQLDSIVQEAATQKAIDAQEIERLKMEAAEQRAAEQKRLHADALRRAATRAILTKKKGSNM